MIGTWLISEAFIRVTLPLATPGIFAGSLLVFIPAVGDYVNAELLGNPQSLMIGNVIQARYLRVTDYPTASALSFILMAAILDRRLPLRPPARHRGAGLMAVARRDDQGADLARDDGPSMGGPMAAADLCASA